MSNAKMGYDLLSPAEKKVYERVEKAFASYATSISGSGIDRGVDFMKILQVVLGDYPRVIYFNKTQIRQVSSMFSGGQFRLVGTLSKAQAGKMEAELQRALNQATEEIMLLNPLSDYDKLMCVYEYLQDRVVYDAQEFEAVCKQRKSRRPQAHTAYGALVTGSAVCDGIASAFCLIAQTLGFDCMTVLGRATFQTDGFSEHAWNIVKIGSACYHLDLTWDINQKSQLGCYSYDYFCLDDDEMANDHDWEINRAPVCKCMNMSFFMKNQCYANNLTQLEDIFRRYAKSKQDVVRVKISRGVAIPEPSETYLGEKLVAVAALVGRHSAIVYSLNRGPVCFSARFVKQDA